MILEAPLLFTAGALGSTHCVGMCGPLAFSVGLGARSFRTNLIRQLIYSLGRISTYSVLGALAGGLGMMIAHRLSGLLLHAQAWLSIVAGVWITFQGLNAWGIHVFQWRMSAGGAGVAPCLAGGMIGGFLGSPRYRDVALAGALTGLLPCGLVYAMLGLSASSASMLTGALTMACFGSGTVPLMLLAGLGSGFITPEFRQRFWRVAAACLICAGLITTTRGILQLNSREHVHVQIDSMYLWEVA
jgi:sulfite exporter TauE/SafE